LKPLPARARVFSITTSARPSSSGRPAVGYTLVAMLFNLYNGTA
jgi:hypothetical protein